MIQMIGRAARNVDGQVHMAHDGSVGGGAMMTGGGGNGGGMNSGGFGGFGLDDVSIMLAG